MLDTPWINLSGVNYERKDNRESLLGFIYRIRGRGWYYIGRKQFWTKRGNGWVESDWRVYKGSSKNVSGRLGEAGIKFEILACFTSKSAIRFGEAAAIITSGSYWPNDDGLNWSFEGCKGKILLKDRDEEQMKHLLEICKDGNLV